MPGKPQTANVGRQACRTFITSNPSQQPSARIIEAKAHLKALQQRGSRSISETRKVSATEISRPQPAPSFQLPPAGFPASIPHAPPKRAPARARPEPLDDSFVGMTGGQIFHEMMLRHEVKHVFGYPGGAILPVFDAIYNSPHFDFILPRHEQGAGHMAEGYARVSGKPGVVLVTSGPGATNVVTPMQDALSDGTPMVVFSGQVATSAIGSDAFQEADIVGISRSCTKWNVMVKDISELPRRINEAFKIATSGRPGPVLVDLPKDVTASTLKQAIPLRFTQPSTLVTQGLVPRPITALHALHAASTPIDLQALDQAAKLIKNAKRPLIFAGQGILVNEKGPQLLAQLAHQGNIPVTTTLQGLGAFDEEDPKALCMIGLHGAAAANFAMQKADVIIGLGVRFDDRVTGRIERFAPAAKAAAANGTGGIIHFEIMPKNINKVVQATCPVEGDVVQNLGALLPMLPAHGPERAEWFDRIREWKRDFPFTYTPSDPSKGEVVKPQEVIEALDTWCTVNNKKDQVIITTGVGQHQMWVAQHYKYKFPRTWVSSGGLGTMGYGVPASIGAKVAAPSKIVVNVDGDASFSMTGMEMATAAQYGIGIKVLILNNDFQGMVLQLQDVYCQGRYSATEMTNPDFVKLAEAMHVKAIRCDNLDDLPAKMKEFMEYDNTKPIVLEARVARKEHVYPFVRAGAALHEQTVFPSLQHLAAATTSAWF